MAISTDDWALIAQTEGPAQVRSRNSRQSASSAMCQALAALLCGLLLSNSAAHSAEPTATAPSRTLSAGDLRFIRSAGTQFPCAMLALLHILHDVPTWQDDPDMEGTVTVDGIPSAAQIAAVTEDLSDGKSIALEISLHRYLYSNSASLQISWHHFNIRPGLDLLSFRAEILDSMGVPLQPPHVLEPEVNVAVAPYGIFLMPTDSSAGPN